MLACVRRRARRQMAKGKARKVKEANKRAEEAERQAGVAKQGLHSIETIWIQTWFDILFLIL